MEERAQLPPLPPPPRLCPPPPRPSNTVVVQVARDQIYRVPPPENAYIVQQHLKPDRARKSQRRSFYTCLAWCLGILFAVALLLAAIAATVYLLARPKLPLFSVEHVAVENGSGGKSAKPEYDITVKSGNPSGRMGYSCLRDGGKAVLSYKGSDVATGKLPALDLDPGESSSTFKFAMASARAVVPLEIQRSMERKTGAKKDDGIPIRVSMGWPVAVRIWGVRSWAMQMAIDCEVRVGFSKEGSRVLRQQCHTNLQL